MRQKKLQPAPKKTIISISLRCASARDVLMGIFQHIEASSNWAVNLMQPEDNPLSVKKLLAAEREGAIAVVITHQCSGELMQALSRTTLPVVFIGIRNRQLKSRKGLTVFVHNDNAAIGDMGARHFFNLGRFNSYGFALTSRENEWSRERANAFRTRIAALAPSTKISVYSPSSATDSESGNAELTEWVESLPKPTAIMADCDARAIDVLAACERTHTSVPDSVAVLGVDNDEFVCAHASTPLSSVLPGHVEMGRIAAETLCKLLKHKSRTRCLSILTVPPNRVVERESTHLRAPSAILVERARLFIQKNATNGIRVQDVASHLRVSRRLVEMRWRAATGGTIRSAIEEVKMTKLKKLLQTTRMSISSIAVECGYRDTDALSHTFRKRFGMSMRKYRASARLTMRNS